jgi:hypothetical protein
MLFVRHEINPNITLHILYSEGVILVFSSLP